MNTPGWTKLLIAVSIINYSIQNIIFLMYQQYKHNNNNNTTTQTNTTRFTNFWWVYVDGEVVIIFCCPQNIDSVFQWLINLLLCLQPFGHQLTVRHCLALWTVTINLLL